MYKTLQSTFTNDKDFPARTFRLSMLTRVIEGALYDNLEYPFDTEENEAHEYVPIRKRRPSVRYGLCRLVVDDSVSLLFSEGHFPGIEATDNTTRDELSRIVRDIGLNEVMIDAATKGSVGSVAIWLRILEGRIFVSPIKTIYLTPTWKATAPDTLEKVTEKYKVKGSDLADAGYPMIESEMSEFFWFQRDFTETQEIRYVPVKVKGEKTTPQPDPDFTTYHDLGFVPIVWVKNLPGGDDVDGAPTFPPEVIDTGIEIDYQLSQAGRGLKYSSDPTLLIKEPARTQTGELIRGASNAITVGPNGDAKMLEIDGSAVEAVISYVRVLRELALETAHGNRTNADKISAAQSGRAMELMNQALIWLADRLRISYGEGAIKDLLSMIIKASAKMQLKHRDGSKVEELKGDGLALRWPAWYPPTATDKQTNANTIKTLKDASLLSQETGVKIIAADHDIEDPADELKLIEKDEAKNPPVPPANTQEKITESI